MCGHTRMKCHLHFARWLMNRPIVARSIIPWLRAGLERSSRCVMPWAFGKFIAAFGTSVLAMAGFLFASGVALSIVSMPFAWYAQFKLEDRFGFNTTTVTTWVLDRLKGFLLAVLLGFPLLALVLKLTEWAGPNWWIW